MIREVIELKNRKDGQTYLVETDCSKGVLIKVAKRNTNSKDRLDYDSFFQDIRNRGYVIRDIAMELIEF